MCPRLSRPVGAFRYLGLGTPKLHSFDLSFLVGLEEAFANHQAPRLGIPNGRLVLWFSKLEHRVVEHRGTFSDVPLVPMCAGLWTMCSALLMLIVLCGSFNRPVMMWRA